jgi:hypothetical protein
MQLPPVRRGATGIIATMPIYRVLITWLAAIPTAPRSDHYPRLMALISISKQTSVPASPPPDGENALVTSFL